MSLRHFEATAPDDVIADWLACEIARETVSSPASPSDRYLVSVHSLLQRVRRGFKGTVVIYDFPNIKVKFTCFVDRVVLVRGHAWKVPSKTSENKRQRHECLCFSS